MANAAIPAPRLGGPTHSRRFQFGVKEPRFLLIALLIAVAFIATFWFVAYENGRPNFTIGANDSLIKHDASSASYMRSITRAHNVGLPIYMKENGIRTKITFAYAKTLKDQTDRVLVSVPVYEGDQFDLRWGTHFTPAPGKPAASNR